MQNEMNHLNSARQITGLYVIQFPSKRWGFVGKVPSVLSYEDKATGGPPTDEQIQTASSFGVRFSGLKTRSWATEAEARAEADVLGFELNN